MSSSIFGTPTAREEEENREKNDLVKRLGMSEEEVFALCSHHVMKGEHLDSNISLQVLF